MGCKGVYTARTCSHDDDVFCVITHKELINAILVEYPIVCVNVVLHDGGKESINYRRLASTTLPHAEILDINHT